MVPTNRNFESDVAHGIGHTACWSCVFPPRGHQHRKTPRKRQRNHETGLILCTYRYYDPNNGRWLNKDPIGYDGGLNVYGYAKGNPVNSVDPLGLADDPIGNFGTGLIRVTLDGFIPTRYAAGGYPALGDDRGFSSRSNGHYRIRQYAIIDPRDGTVKIYSMVGGSEDALGNRGHENSKGMQGSAYCKNGEWHINFSGKAKYPLNPAAPPIDWNLIVVVTEKGAWVSGTHDRYPAYEVWLYKDGASPSQKYGRMPSSRETVFDLARPQMKVGQ